MKQTNDGGTGTDESAALTRVDTEELKQTVPDPASTGDRTRSTGWQCSTRDQRATSFCRIQQITTSLQDVSSSVQFSSVQFKMASMRAWEGLYMRSTPSPRSFPNVTLDTVPVLV